MKVPFVDLGAQYAAIRSDVDRAIAAVIRDAAFIGSRENPYVRAFEDEFARWLGVEHCVACANGTDAIEILLQALGIKPGDEVLVPAHSWISSAEAVTAVGARPVFVDTKPDTFTIDPELVARCVTSRTRAVIPVHLYGLPADLGPLLAVARQHGLKVIEDCAQAHGATYQGRTVGTFGDAAAFSFFPSKNLGAYGDAGAMVMHDAEVADRARMIANHGQLAKHDHQIEGRNSRLDGLQAAILSVKLPQLRRWTSQRQAHAARYGDLLGDVPVRLPVVSPMSTHVFHLYVIQTDHRDGLRQALTSGGIGCAVHYPRALPTLPAYASRGCRAADYPTATGTAGRILSLPMYPELTDEMLAHVAGTIGSFWAAKATVRA